MSEETEVKKDKLWVKIKVQEELENWEGVEGGLDEEAIKYILNIIDQLDEPEVLSLEWIDEKSFPIIHRAREKDVVPVKDLQGILVPKQEKVKVPQFVADIIENNKEKTTPLKKLFSDIEKNKKQHYQTDAMEWVDNNQEAFARAWLDGFTVEEEQKYYAKLKEIRPLEGEWLTNLSGPNYYVLDTKGLMLGEFILDLIGMKTEASTHTLKDWERYGINDSNADFVKVEELEV